METRELTNALKGKKIKVQSYYQKPDGKFGTKTNTLTIQDVLITIDNEGVIIADKRMRGLYLSMLKAEWLVTYKQTHDDIKHITIID